MNDPWVGDWRDRLRRLGPVKLAALAVIAAIVIGQIVGNVYVAVSSHNRPRYLVENGQTVWGGEKVANVYQLPWLSVWRHPEYAGKAIEDYGVVPALMAIFLGVVPSPAQKWIHGDYKISGSWIIANYKGPGVAVIKNDHLYVKAPGILVWGRKIPIVKGVKISENEVKVGNKVLTLKEIAEKYGKLNAEYVKKVDVGDTVTVYSKLKFYDGRKPMTEKQVKEIFGYDAYKKAVEMSDYSAVPVWLGPHKLKLIGYAETTMEGVGSHDNLRLQNAEHMVDGWNGVIVPPHSWTHGKREQYEVFNVPGYKTAAHGCCPPARALRNACLKAGLPKPFGIDMSEHPMEYGVNPTSGVIVYNTKPYPILIRMGWKGKPAIGGTIWCAIYEILPAKSK